MTAVMFVLLACEREVIPVGGLAMVAVLLSIKNTPNNNPGDAGVMDAPVDTLLPLDFVGLPAMPVVEQFRYTIAKAALFDPPVPANA